MRFDRILGNCDIKLVQSSEERLSSTFTELAMAYDNQGFGSKVGGDVFLHQLISPLKQICDARSIEFEAESERIRNLTHTPEGVALTDEDRDFLIGEVRHRLGDRLLYTAATNGKAFFWCPKFVVERSSIGLRLVVGHEGQHTIYMHPTRRGSRNHALWNISVDFKVNFNLMDDLRTRNFRHADEVFRKELGDFITIGEYSAFIKDPFNPPAKLAGWNPMTSLKNMLNPGFVKEDKKQSFYYAEPNLHDDLKQPENIYEFLFNQIPKCNLCGKLGNWKKPQEYKNLEKQLQEKKQDEANHQHE